jgi:hypothetical protein
MTNINEDDIIYANILTNLEKVKNLKESNDFLKEINLKIKNILGKYSITKLPNEIMESIFKNLNMKDLFKLKLVSRNWNTIVSEYISKNMSYYIMIVINLSNKKPYKELMYMHIKCNICEENCIEKDYNELLTIFKKCQYCKYKLFNKINAIKYKHIKYLKIKIIYTCVSEVYMSIQKIIYDNYLKGNNIINMLYNKYEINNTDLYFRVIFSDHPRYYSVSDFKNIFEMVLNNSKNSVRILKNPDDYKNLELNVDNSKLKKITISTRLLECIKNIRLKNVNDICLHNKCTFNEIIFNNINIYLKKISLTIHTIDDLLNNNIVKIKKIDVLELEFFIYSISEYINDYIKLEHILTRLKHQYNINKIMVIPRQPDEKKIRILSNIFYIDKIIINKKRKKFNYFNKYKKIMFR